MLFVVFVCVCLLVFVGSRSSLDNPFQYFVQFACSFLFFISMRYCVELCCIVLLCHYCIYIDALFHSIAINLFTNTRSIV